MPTIRQFHCNYFSFDGSQPHSRWRASAFRMSLRPAFAKKVFLIAGVYGLMALVPQYFMEGRLSLRFPPPLTHPEHFYGFIWRGDRMAVRVLYNCAGCSAFAQLHVTCGIGETFLRCSHLGALREGLVTVPVLCAAAIDLLFAILFILAYVAVGNVTDSKHTEALNHFSFVFRRAGDAERS